MNSAHLGAILRRLREVAPRGAETDGALLARYAHGDEGTFAQMVERYSGLVWGVGRRILHRQQDGEDIFQATFLALSRKSSSLIGEFSLAPWLYTVAVRLSLNMKRRRQHERFLMEMAEPATLADPSAEVSGRELAQAFDEEMERLPKKFREAVVLCCLEGLSRDEAAGSAGCTLGAMKNRLERGRSLLRKRLERRGIAVPTTLLLVGMTNRIAPAAVCTAACRVFETASPSVVALASEAIAGSMMMKAIVLTIALGLTAVCIGIGGSLLADSEPVPKTAPAAEIAQAKQPSKEEPANVPKPRLDRFGDPLSGEALARFGTVRFRQGYRFNDVIFSPDKKMLAITSDSRPLGLWDVASGKELFQFAGIHNGAIAFSPDGKLLADGGFNDIRLWDTQTGKLTGALKSPTSPRSILFSPDGKTVISARIDRMIRFWDLQTRKETAKINDAIGDNPKDRYEEPILALSLDGKLLAMAGTGDIVRVWDAKTRKLLKELPAPEMQYFRSMSFSPDGKQLAVKSLGKFVIWEIAKGEPVHKLHESLKSLNVWNLAYSPNGKWLATSSGDGAIRLWDPQTEKEVQRFETHSNYFFNVVFSADSKTIVSSSLGESTVRFWDVETGKETHPNDVH